MLTPKQERYCVNRAIKRMSQRKAYIDAFPSSKGWKSNTVDARACELERERKILGRIEELEAEEKERISKEAAWTRNDALKELKSLIEKANEQIENNGYMSGPSVTAIVSAVKELNVIFDVGTEKTAVDNDGFIEALNGTAKEVWTDEETDDIPV